MIRFLWLGLSMDSAVLAPLCRAGATLPVRGVEPVEAGMAADVVVVPIGGEAVLFAA
jgi:hypothetical protein